jgi:hypothetical protein
MTHKVSHASATEESGTALERWIKLVHIASLNLSLCMLDLYFLYFQQEKSLYFVTENPLKLINYSVMYILFYSRKLMNFIPKMGL